MVTVPLGRGAYRRAYAGEPEVRLVNRFVETNPTNLREQIALIARPGTDELDVFGAGPIRAIFSKKDLFESDLFVVSADALYRRGKDGLITTITGTVPDETFVPSTWMKGIGYEYLFIATDTTLKYYAGGTHATGTLTKTGSITTQVIRIGTLYYTWDATVTEPPVQIGTATRPYRALLTSNPLEQMAKLLNFDGTPGVDFSPGLPGQNAQVTAVANNPSAGGVLTVSGGAITNQVFQIGNAYYSWDVNVDNNAPYGSAAHPWLAKLGNTTAKSLANMVKLINFSGVSGEDYSTIIASSSPYVTAVSDNTTITVTALESGTAANATPTTVYSGSFISWGAATLAGGADTATTLVITARTDSALGNTIVTEVVSGAGIAWGAATLTGGGTHELKAVPVPDGNPVAGLATVSSYVLVALANSQKFFWLNPGEVTIDPLNFAEKESSPDNIVDMATVGDQVLIVGQSSAENWYATGNIDAPFAPMEGRVYQRGAVPGTLVVVKDAVILVGNDGVVYSVGYHYGAASEWGVKRISDHGIEERIRAQLRSEQGLVA